MLFRFRDEVVSWGESALTLPDAQQNERFALVCGAVGEGVTVRGDMTGALELADRALHELPDPDDERRVYPLRVRGMVALYVGRLEDGLREHAEMLRLARLHERPYEAGMALLGLAQSRTYAGDPARGLVFAREQHDVVQPLGNPSMLSLAWYDQAEALATMEPPAAIEAYRRAVELAESAGSTFVEGIALVGLASLLGRSADPEVAFPLFGSIVGRWRRMGVWHHQWTTLRNLLQLLVRTERWPAAAVLFAAIDAGSRSAPAFGTDADLLRAAADRIARALDAGAFWAACSQGARMSRDEAVSFACAAIDEALASGRARVDRRASASAAVPSHHT
jgi:tetratricopeptide (TPR) repeat protein